MILTGLRGNPRSVLTFYRLLQGLQSAFLVCISIFAAALTLVSLRSLSRISDPLSSPGVLDHLSLWMGVHERTAVVVWEIDDWCSNVFVFIYQSQPSDGSFYITHEHRESLLPSLLGDEERTPPNGSFLSLEEKIAELASVSKKYLPATSQHSSSIDHLSSPQFPILVRLSSRAFSHPNKDAVLLSLDAFLRNESSFTYKRESSIGLLDPQDRTALQWFAINLIRKTFVLPGFSISQTVLIFNVRESSLELTFAINASALGSFTAFPHIQYRTYKLRAYGHLIQLLTLRFPGLGLYSGRKGIYGLDKGAESKSVRSPCMNPIVNGSWEVEGSLLNVQGLDPPEYEMVKEKDGPFAGKKVNKPVANIPRCKGKALDYLARSLFPQAGNGSEAFKKVFSSLGRVRPVFIEGLFLEKTFEQGLSLPLRGGDIACKALFESLKYACKSPNTEQPFSCTDMIYLITLTQEVLGFKSSYCSLHSPRNINRGMNGDWPLGAAFYVYQNGL